MTELNRPVSELMEREVATLQRSDRLDLADDIMRLGRIRHLPVLEGDRLVGILSNRDLLAASLTRAMDFEPSHRRAFMRSVEVKEVMTQDVYTLGPNASVEEAGRQMLRRQIGCIPVVKSRGELLGLITETGLLKAALRIEDDVVDVSSEPAKPFEAELEGLRRVRDELRVQIHLGKAEATELWEKLERRFVEAEAHAKALAARAEEPAQDVAEAVDLLVDEIRNGYKRLREII
jgi:CBS domain-containing protein/ribosome-associated translation inhibitor RaiA